MGESLELLTGIATAPSSTLTGITMNSGNSLTIRNASPDSNVSLIQTWVDSQGGGILRIMSPLLHDNVQGLRFRHVASEVDPLLPQEFSQPLFPQDTLTVELTGSATAGDIETACLLVYYQDLPGVSGNFLDPQGVKDRLRNIVTVENTISTGTSGGYSGEEAINTEFDLLKANTEYAIVGYHVSAECACVRYRSVDFGNLGVGGPGNDTDKQLTGRWFDHLSRLVGTALIPVFNSANASGLLIDCSQDENGTDVIVSTILAELTPAG